MKVLVMLVNEYEGYLADCERPIYILLLQLYKMQLPCLSAPRLHKAHQDEIERQLLNATEPILKNLLDSDRFISLVTGEDTGGSDDIALPHLLLQIIVLGLLPTTTDEVQKKWMIPSTYTEDEVRTGVIMAVFNSCEKCHTELLIGGSLPGVMCSGKPQRFVSLYEHVCTRLCGFVGSLSTDQFSTLENCLLENVISADPICSQLASDVWCFVNRYGSADLCMSHIQLFCSMVRQSCVSDISEYRALLKLIGRLIKFMAPEHQENLCTVCPVEENLGVWSYIPFTELASEVQTGLVNSLSTTCLQSIEKWLDATPKKLTLLLNLNCCLEVLCNIFKSFGAQEDGPLGECLPRLLEKYFKLCSCLPISRDPHSRTSCHSERTLCLIVECGGHLIHQFNNTVLLQVLHVFITLLKETSSIELKLSLCHFLQRCSSVQIYTTAEHTQILMSLAGLIHSLLTDSHILVQHNVCQLITLDTSQQTSLLGHSLQNDAELQNKLSSYLQKSVKGELQSKKVKRVQSQKEALDKFKSLTVEDRVALKSSHLTLKNHCTDLLDSISEEPAAKKPRLESDCLEVDMTKENEQKDLLKKTQLIGARWIELIQSNSLSPSILEALLLTNRDLSTALATQKDNG